MERGNDGILEGWNHGKEIGMERWSAEMRTEETVNRGFNRFRVSNCGALCFTQYSSMPLFQCSIISVFPHWIGGKI